MHNSSTPVLKIAFLILVLGIFLPDLTLAISRRSCSDLLKVSAGDFVTYRDFKEYNKLFNNDLTALLQSYSKVGGHWVDMGAGKGLALQTYFQEFKKSKIRATGVGYKHPEDIILDPRINFVEGWFDAKKPEKIGKADIITDVFGILQWTKSENMPELLDIYISMLNPGGVILLNWDYSYRIRKSWLRGTGRIRAEVRKRPTGGFYTVIYKAN